ncbi:hypothetical protein ACFY4F_04580 [Peribacillus butanolivorans]|uniref:hypothetical protein n=1 Tax=Peribacillus butanolivorans TaxID=421767 RepID=UPI0036B03A95
MVFYTKATLDIISEWLNEKYSLKLKGSFISLSKKRFQEELVAAEPDYLNLFEDHKDFLHEFRSLQTELDTQSSWCRYDWWR